jgi:hypothetical protein
VITAPWSSSTAGMPSGQMTTSSPTSVNAKLAAEACTVTTSFAA